MGMPLPSLHSPSIASSSNNATASETTSIQDLIRQKDNLESELKALGSILDSHNVTMHTTLTSFDGYPRADIDIAQIRTARARIIHLRNDHKAVMERIEKALHAHFAEGEAMEKEEEEKRKKDGASTETTINEMNGNGASAAPPTQTQTPIPTQSQSQPAFALVHTVAPNSPAETAGLKAGDRVLQFGDADWRNHEKLAKVAQIVGRSEGRRIEVVVARVREGQEGVVRVDVVPRRDWGGRGTLGCHLKGV